MTNRLTPEQVAAIAASGTPAGTTVAQWVAKSRQESGHDADAVSPTGCCIGLWQVNVDANSDLIQESQVSRGNAVSVMKSPWRNWAVTRAIYERQGWAAWKASGGKPVPTQRDKQAAQNPDNSMSPGDIGEAIPGIGPVNPIDDVADFLGQIIDPVLSAAKWLGDPGNWVRIIQVGGGITLGIVALSIALKPVSREVVGTVSKAKGF